MRLDNRLPCPWFRFPDLASFPDYAGEQRQGDIGTDEFYAAYADADAEYFTELLTGYMDSRSKLFGRIVRMFKHYSKYNAHSAIAEDSKCWVDLYERGLHLTKLDIGKLDLSAEIKSLLAKPDNDPPPGKFDRSLNLSPPQLAVVAAMFTNAGILKGASAYACKPLSVASAVLHVSMPTDKHYKQFFMDATTTPHWTNTHIDPKEDAVKAMIYLDAVGGDDGPFGYVPGSNRFMHDPLQEVFGRAIATGNYCKSPEERKPVFNLPSRFRVSYNFGRCVMDDSLLAYELGKRLSRVLGEAGTTAVFDAGAGIHQGGIVSDGGRRIAVQVLMK